MSRSFEKVMKFTLDDIPDEMYDELVRQVISELRVAQTSLDKAQGKVTVYYDDLFNFVMKDIEVIPD